MKLIKLYMDYPFKVTWWKMKREEAMNAPGTIATYVASFASPQQILHIVSVYSSKSHKDIIQGVFQSRKTARIQYKIFLDVIKQELKEEKEKTNSIMSEVKELLE
jgi:hypothetical protein